MTFRIGDKVVNPSQGPVSDRCSREEGNCRRADQVLSLLDDSRDAVPVRVEKIRVLESIPLVESFEVIDSTLHEIASSAA